MITKLDMLVRHSSHCLTTPLNWNFE